MASEQSGEETMLYAGDLLESTSCGAEGEFEIRWTGSAPSAFGIGDRRNSFAFRRDNLSGIVTVLKPFLEVKNRGIAALNGGNYVHSPGSGEEREGVNASHRNKR
jgi:hypothetical protein